MWKNITISKIKDVKSEKSPTHELVVTDEDFKNKKTVGKLWTREGQFGKFLSGKMNDKYSLMKDDGKNIELDGYVIISETELEKLKAPQPTEVNDNKAYLESVNQRTADIIYPDSKPLSQEEQDSLSEIPF